MPDGFPPVPPRDPAEPTTDYPPAPPVAPAEPRFEPAPVVSAGQPAYGVPAPVPARRSGRAWVWWTIGIVMLLALIVGSCMLPVIFLSSEGNMPDVGGEGLAVIRVDGVIAGTGDYYSGYITPEYFLDMIEMAEDDERVKAIVLRVDSPGGTVAASEEIATYVKECEKPVVVSVGDVGASGAYMISSQADSIWANPGSSVGSIGVIAQIPNVSGLLDMVGVEFQTFTAGEYKDAGSAYRDLTKEEEALIQGEVEEAYDQFIDIVAEGRGLERAKVEELAIGWTWSGVRAKELGLVDEVGTYRDALEDAAERGGIEGDYEIVTYEDEFGDILGTLLSLTDRLGGLDAISSEALQREALPR